MAHTETAAHLLTGVLPEHAEPGDEVLVTVWEDGSAELSIRKYGRWTPGQGLKAQPL